MQVYAQLPTVQPHDCVHTATCISLMCSHTTKQEHCEDTHSQLTSIQYPGTAEHHAIKPTLVFAPLDHQTVSSIAHTLFNCAWEVCEQQDRAKWTSGHG